MDSHRRERLQFAVFVVAAAVALAIEIAGSALLVARVLPHIF